MSSYDRYADFRRNGKIAPVPFIPIQEKDSDFYVTYDRSTMRLDILSYKYYGNPDYAWLIMQANPQYGSMEFEIPDKVDLRIPFPLDATLRLYKEGIKKYQDLY